MIKTFVCDRCGAETGKDYTTSIWGNWIAGAEKIPTCYDLCRNCAYEFRAFLVGKREQPDFRKEFEEMQRAIWWGLQDQDGGHDES